MSSGRRTLAPDGRPCAALRLSVVGPTVVLVFETEDPSPPEALRLIAGLRAQAGELVTCAERALALSPVEKARALEELAAARRTVDAAHLALVRALTPADAAELGAGSVPALLSWRLRVPAGRARADVEAARVTDPDTGQLRGLGAALVAGEVTMGHVDVGRRTLDHLPVALRTEHAAGIDAFVVEQSATFRPGEVEHLAARVLDHIDPSRESRGFDPDDFARRYATLSTDSTGMVQLRAQLDPVAGAQLKAAIDHYAAPVPAATTPVAGTQVDGQTSVRIADDRTPGQRRADALGRIARQALASTGVRGGEPPRVIVTATTDQVVRTPGAGQATCEQTGPLSAVALRRLQCDAALSAVLLAPSGAVISLGRTVRCATPAQRRALIARDTGCVIPGCDVPSAQLDVHHVTAWAAGGRTDITDLVLACGPHHTMLELGTWGVRMVDGLPQVRAPRWVDPDQRWLHPPRPAAHRRATALGEQLALATPDDPAPPPEHPTPPEHEPPDERAPQQRPPGRPPPTC